MALPRSITVTVIGAGVVGLTTAVKIQEANPGYKVKIVSHVLPEDPKTIAYTSQWAGAHHVSLAGDDERQQKMDQDTFAVMWELSTPGHEAEHCFFRIPQTEYYCEQRPTPNPLEHMPNFTQLDEAQLVENTVCGVKFTTLTIEPARYLVYLKDRFLSGGGSIARQMVQSIDEIANTADAVVVCAGLGSRMLLQDTSMYPIRGQTVILRAPWVNFGVTQSSYDGLWTYIIPRKSGQVVLGGTKDANDWEPVPRSDTTADILRRCLQLCPQLAPPEIRTKREPFVEDLTPLIEEKGCGLRPAREGGIRLDLIWHDSQSSQKRVPVITNYGHGGYGYQSSWGSASKASELLSSALSKNGL